MRDFITADPVAALLCCFVTAGVLVAEDLELPRYLHIWREQWRAVVELLEERT